jgi:hypothetical protein
MVSAGVSSPQEHFTCRRQAYTSTMAFEDRPTEPVFKELYPPTDRRLVKAKLRRGTAKASPFRCHKSAAQIAKVKR